MIYACGPEGSGTHLLAELLCSIGVEATQRSLPHGGVWWINEAGVCFDPQSWEPFEPSAKFVMIVRDRFCTIQSVLRRHLAATERDAGRARSIAVARLAQLHPVRVSYERLVAEPVPAIQSILSGLGIPEPESWELPEVRDENAKWLVA